MLSTSQSHNTWLDAASIRAIEAILKRGNNAEVRRKGGGCVVLEIKKSIVYAPDESASGKSNRS